VLFGVELPATQR